MRTKKIEADKKQRIGMLQRLGLKLDIPADVLSGIYIELRGRNNLTVKGCRKILRYNTEEVRLRLNGEVLLVCGSSLYCTAYHSGVIEIDGLIDSVAFIDRAES